MNKLLCGIVGVAGLAAAANAQTWSTNHEFRLGTTTGPIAAAGGVFNVGAGGDITATGTYTFTVRAGIFNLQGAAPGDTNQGLFNWTSTVNASGLGAGETLGVTSNNSRQVPFVFGPATSFGGTLADPSSIVNVNAARDVAGGASAPWAFGNPAPTGPTPGAAGANSFANVWRFQVTINSLFGGDIVINFAGSAGPVLRWEVFGEVEPDEENAGSRNFLGITRAQSAGGPLDQYAPTTLTLHRVPAPGAMALLGLGGLVAARRRRA